MDERKDKDELEVRLGAAFAIVAGYLPAIKPIYGGVYLSSSHLADCKSFKVRLVCPPSPQQFRDPLRLALVLVVKQPWSLLSNSQTSSMPMLSNSLIALAKRSRFQGTEDPKETAEIVSLTRASLLCSVSGEAARRPEVVKMAHWLEVQLHKYGVVTEKRDLGKQELEGQTLDLPPAILGRIGDDPKKKTILIYGHFDVQPVRLTADHMAVDVLICFHIQAFKSDGWDHEPFTLHFDKETGKLFGRGSTDDKGPILGWINVLEAHHALGLPLPVNLRFCFEGMEESGSEGLDELIASEAGKGAQGWFGGVDAVCIVSADSHQYREEWSHYWKRRS